MENKKKFESDIVQAILKAYSEAKIPYDCSKNDYQDVLLGYITILDKLIVPEKRKVHISKELSAKISGTDEESLRLKGLVENIKLKIESGVDVNGHLSKRVLSDFDKADKMFADGYYDIY